MTEDMLEQEPLLDADREVLGAGTKAPEFVLSLPSGLDLSLNELLRNGPLLLNFIKGVWCPFCQRHLSNLQRWRTTLMKKKVVIAVASNEPVYVLQQWLKTHPVNFLFGSIHESSVFKSYGVDLRSHAFPRPATFLIDVDGTIRFSYQNERGTKLEKKIENIAL